LERTSELQTALDKLTELNSLKNNFISNISHELRTPLAHMIGYIDLLSDESLGPLTAEQMTAMDVLVKAANRLQKLIDNLLQFSIASQGYMQLDIKPVSVQLIIKSAISKNVGRADDAEVALKVDAPIDPIHVLADGEKIIWVLEQLVDNGIKFNHPGGSVLVSAKIESGVRVNFSVVDSGIGIPEKRIEEIFEEFHQLDGSTTRRYGGTGLGLSLAKRILDAHDVELKVSSKDADGTRFEFALPAVKKQT
jgi:signal transduction histidine kinase